MKLHANAALSLKKREQLVQRAVAEGWSLTKAAAAAEVSEPTAASGPSVTAPRARPACSIGPRPPTTSTTAPPRTESR